MKKLIYLFVWAMTFSGCMKTNYLDTGLADGKHDVTVWEYMQAGRGNWDSAVVIIKRAGLVSLFDGTDQQYSDGFTFFGFTNYSVRNFLFETLDDNWEPLYTCINDIPVELCKKMVLGYIIPGKRMMGDFDYEIRRVVKPGEPLITGGTSVQTMAGKELIVYRMKNAYNGVPDVGADKLGIYAPESEAIAKIASCNIETKNAVVHSLTTDFIWSEL